MALPRDIQEAIAALEQCDLSAHEEEMNEKISTMSQYTQELAKHRQLEGSPLCRTLRSLATKLFNIAALNASQISINNKKVNTKEL